jgi:hypothetical protein
MNNIFYITQKHFQIILILFGLAKQNILKQSVPKRFARKYPYGNPVGIWRGQGMAFSSVHPAQLQITIG